MSDSNFNIDAADAPMQIKNTLHRLSTTIEFHKQSNKGTNSYLFFGMNTINKIRVAVKFYEWGGDPKYHAEPASLASINAPNVIQILDAAVVDNEYAYFMTPYLPQGDLEDYIGHGIRGNRQAVRFIYDILNGLSHLHAKRLLHCDIKPQNILLSDEGNALIGDFGSVKHIPEGMSTIPGSGHSLIYRPPESVENNQYGKTGDLYQVGILLYQLLGGSLPYPMRAWLKPSELKRFDRESDPIEKQIFGNDCVKKRITRGEVIKKNSIPPWVCQPLRRTISKACNVDPAKRFQSSSEFLAHLGNLANYIHDWRIIKSIPTYVGRTSFRIRRDEERRAFFVEKKKRLAWRTDNSFIGSEIAELVEQIEDRIANN